MDRIIAVNSNTYHGYSIDDAIDGIANAGFRYIELTATKGWTEHVFSDHTFSQLLHVKNELKDRKLIPFSLSGHCNLMDPDRIQDFITNIELASFFGCEYIVSSIGEAHIDNKVDTSEKIAEENIATLIPILRSHGMKLVLETHGSIGTGVKMDRIVKNLNSAYVKINYDTANVIFYGGVDPADDLSKCEKDVAYLHLKDKAGEPNEWNFPALGDGYVDFPAIFHVLNKNNNNSPLSIEIEFTPQGPGSLEAVNNAVRKSYRYLEEHNFFNDEG